MAISRFIDKCFNKKSGKAIAGFFTFSHSLGTNGGS